MNIQIKKSQKIQLLFLLIAVIIAGFFISKEFSGINQKSTAKRESANSPSFYIPSKDTVFQKPTSAYYNNKKEQTNFDSGKDFYTNQTKYKEQSDAIKEAITKQDNLLADTNSAVASSPPDTTQKTSTPNTITHPPKKSSQKARTNKPPTPTKEDKLRALEKKYGRANSSTTTSEPSSIAISVRGNQTITSGQSIWFELLDNLNIDGVTILKYSTFKGIVSFSQYRVNVNVNSIAYNDKIYHINYKVYGLDGIEGIPINTDKILDRTKNETVDDAINEIPSEIPAGKTIGRILSGNNKEVKVEISNGTRLLLTNN